MSEERKKTSVVFETWREDGMWYAEEHGWDNNIRGEAEARSEAIIDYVEQFQEAHEN